MSIAIRGGSPLVVATTANPISGTLTSTRQPQAGDLLLIIHGNDYYALSNMPTPTVGGSTSGVNPITSGTADGGSLFAHAKSYTYAVGSTGDLTVSVTETGIGDEEKCLVVYVLSGADTSTPTDGAANNTDNTGSTTNRVCSAVSPSTSDAFLIVHTNDGNGSNSVSYTPASGMSEQYDGSLGGAMGYSGDTQQLSSSGSTGTKTLVAAGNASYCSLTIAVRTAAAAAATYPPPNVRSRRPVPFRIARSRQTVPVRAQVNPPNPIQEITQPRRVRGLLPRRGQIRQVVPPQFNPPFPWQEIAQPRRPRGWLLRRGRSVVPVPGQGAPVDEVDQPRRFRGLLLRRGKLAQTIPPQFNPPYPWVDLVQPRRLRGLLPRRGRQFTPVPAQVVLTPPAYPPQTMRVRTKVLRWFRGRQAQPVPAQVVVAAPGWVPDRPRRARVLAALRRAHVTTPVPADVPVPDRLRGRRQPPSPIPRRVRTAAPVMSQPQPPDRRPRRSLLGLLRRSKTAFPLKQQPPPPNPAFVPATSRRRLLVARVRRGEVWWVSHACIVPRPGGGTTGRPGGGTTARPDTGSTDDPC